MRALLEADADGNKAPDDGDPPLSISLTPVANVAQGEHAAIVKILRDAGARR